MTLQSLLNKPLSSQKTIGAGGVFGESKMKIFFLESQISSIKKAASRYDSKKSSESAEELGVDLFETINQIELANSQKRESMGIKEKSKSKNKGVRRRVKSSEKMLKFFEEISKELDSPPNKTTSSLPDLYSGYFNRIYANKNEGFQVQNSHKPLISSSKNESSKQQKISKEVNDISFKVLGKVE